MKAGEEREKKQGVVSCVLVTSEKSGPRAPLPHTSRTAAPAPAPHAARLNQGRIGIREMAKRLRAAALPWGESLGSPANGLDDGCLMHIFSFLSPIPGPIPFARLALPGEVNREKSVDPA